MSDTDTSVPAETTYSGDARDLRQAADDLAVKHAVAEYNPPAPEIPPPPEEKRIADDGESPLSSRQAARLLAQQKHDEALRAASYREGLADAWAADAANRTGESPNQSALFCRRPLAAERAQLEAERAQIAQERESRPIARAPITRHFAK